MDPFFTGFSPLIFTSSVSPRLCDTSGNKTKQNKVKQNKNCFFLLEFYLPVLYRLANVLKKEKHVSRTSTPKFVCFQNFKDQTPSFCLFWSFFSVLYTFKFLFRYYYWRASLLTGSHVNPFRLSLP